MQIKITLGYHCVPTKKGTITVPGVGKKAEQLDLSYFAGEYVNFFSRLENCLDKNVSSFIHNKPQTENSSPVHQQESRENVVNLHSGVIKAQHKEQMTDSHSTMSESHSIMSAKEAR